MRAVIAIAIVSACGGGGSGPDALGTTDAGGDGPRWDANVNANHYETTFDGDEAPLSEGGT